MACGEQLCIKCSNVDCSQEIPTVDVVSNIGYHIKCKDVPSRIGTNIPITERQRPHLKKGVYIKALANYNLEVISFSHFLPCWNKKTNLAIEVFSGTLDHQASLS